MHAPKLSSAFGSTLLLLLILLISFTHPSSASPHKLAPRGPMPDPSLPYQYFMMGEMSATAVCWLTAQPFRHNSAQYPNLDCKISSAISQLPDRQTWQCTGDRDAFCKECFRVRDEMDAVHRGKYRQQGCD